MPADRPTFSESWYRVAQLRPRLRCTVQTYRQHYRGRMWHVVRDPASNQFYRVDDAAYFFIGLLDGRRTVAEAWETANERLGDAAPTQGEVIQTLGQLYAANLLQAELAGDAASLFERYKKRVHREIRGYIMNIMFMRIPLFDPERILSQWVSVFGLVFTWPGFMVWLGLVLYACYMLVGSVDQLRAEASNVLDPGNLLPLYVCMAGIKAIHEFGHGFACKWFGRRSHSGGEVHTMGILMMVFLPLPYVDASSAWALRSKWQRAIVGAAGMYVELAVAAVAAIVWVNTGQTAKVMGVNIHTLAYNLIFIASVSTILFNANPLLRYDGYYILSDLLEIPNLAQRGKDYVYYLIKRYVFGVHKLSTPAQTTGERPWLVVYTIAASIYRVFISFAILLYVADKFFMVGAILAMVSIFAWVIAPLFKLVQFLFTSDELARVRPRALTISGAVAAAIVLGVGVIPVPEHDRAQGIVQPRELKDVFSTGEGFVTQVIHSGERVSPDGRPLLVAVNPRLDTEIIDVEAQQVIAMTEWRVKSAGGRLRGESESGRQVDAQIRAEKVAAIQTHLNRLLEDREDLQVFAPAEGFWVSPNIDQVEGAYVRRGDMLGKIATTDDLIIRVAADQRLGGRLLDGEVPLGATVEMRVAGRPEDYVVGVVEKLPVAGSHFLPSPALGVPGGGSIDVDPQDEHGVRVVEPFFEVIVRPTLQGEELPVRLLTGQRLVVRFKLPSRPLAAQWYRALRQLVQRKYGV